MSRLYIVVEQLKDWDVYFPSEHLVTAEQYLAGAGGIAQQRGVRVINLCRNFDYLGLGYYVSLLAEARGHRCLPSISTVNDVAVKRLYKLALDGIDQALDEVLQNHESDEFTFKLFFGRTLDDDLADIGRQIFEQLPCPLLSVTFRKRTRWHVDTIKTPNLLDLEDVEEDLFADALDHFSRKVWRSSSRKRKYRYDLAILVDPEEKIPPSNPAALRKMVRMGRKMGMDVSLITSRDYLRLAEYDALFIRATTRTNHFTYRFARRAQKEGMVVIDDPQSIMRCSNKVYLAERMAAAGLPTPKTRLLVKGDQQSIDQLIADNIFPLILKIPDGAFSRGMTKVDNATELQDALREHFSESKVVLVQEYMYTDFDWRIGVIGGDPVYACRYHMSSGHWQIYHHKADGKVSSGESDAVPIYQVPNAVVRAAVKAANLIGDGFYGVDIKQSGDRIAIIEVNDNPSIDHGVEDEYLGDDLYWRLMSEFLRRLERKRMS